MSFSISNNGSCDANAHSRRQTNTDRQTDVYTKTDRENIKGENDRQK